MWHCAESRPSDPLSLPRTQIDSQWGPQAHLETRWFGTRTQQPARLTTLGSNCALRLLYSIIIEDIPAAAVFFLVLLLLVCTIRILAFMLIGFVSARVLCFCSYFLPIAGRWALFPCSVHFCALVNVDHGCISLDGDDGLPIARQRDVCIMNWPLAFAEPNVPARSLLWILSAWPTYKQHIRAHVVRVYAAICNRFSAVVKVDGVMIGALRAAEYLFSADIIHRDGIMIGRRHRT